MVSQFLNSPSQDHWNTIIRVLKYNKASLEKGLFYGSNNHTRIVYYSDANCVGSPTDRRSTSKYYVSIGDNLISWKSK